MCVGDLPVAVINLGQSRGAERWTFSTGRAITAQQPNKSQPLSLGLSTPFSLLSSLSFSLFHSLYLTKSSTPCRLHLSIYRGSPLFFFRAHSLFFLRLSVRLCACVCDLVTHGLRQIWFCAAGFGSTPREQLGEVKALRLLWSVLEAGCESVCHGKKSETEKEDSARECSKNLQSRRTRANSHARPLLFHAILMWEGRRRLAHHRGVAMATPCAARAQ